MKHAKLTKLLKHAKHANFLKHAKHANFLKHIKHVSFLKHGKQVISWSMPSTRAHKAFKAREHTKYVSTSSM